MTIHLEHGQALLPTAIARQERLTHLETTTRIDVRNRNGWHQITPWDLYDPDLHDRMNEIALAEYNRNRGHRRITVTATNIATGERISITRGEPIPPCPRCGYITPAGVIVKEP